MKFKIQDCFNESDRLQGTAEIPVTRRSVAGARRGDKNASKTERSVLATTPIRGRRYRASRFVTDIDITVKRSFPRIVDRFSTRERSLFTADAFSVWTRRRARWNGQVCIEKDNVDTGTPEEITLTALMCFRSQRTVTVDEESLGFA